MHTHPSIALRLAAERQADTRRSNRVARPIQGGGRLGRLRALSRRPAPQPQPLPALHLGGP